MLKKGLSLMLALAFALALIPAGAEATVLSGWASKVDYENTDPNKYAVEIDVTNQVITVYSGSIGGAIVLQSLCTTGSDEHPTSRGTYKMGALKERFGYFVAYGQYAQYWSQVVRGIYIHSVMYNSKKVSSMSKSAYRDLGKNVSHGCVRVLPDVAQWIYYNCPPGTVCKVTKKARDEELVKKLKAAIPSYDNYTQPKDSKVDPSEIPAVIRYDGTPIRTGSSSTNDKTIGYLASGTKIMLLQLAQDWCKVRTDAGQIGYVKSQYILAYPDSAVETAQGYAASAKTYVYASAKTSAETLKRIPSGARLTLISRVSDGWWYGTYDGVTGYIRNKYVKTVSDYVFPQLTQTPESTPSAGGTGSTGGLLGGGASTSGNSQPSGTSRPSGGSSGGLIGGN